MTCRHRVMPCSSKPKLWHKSRHWARRIRESWFHTMCLLPPTLAPRPTSIGAWTHSHRELTIPLRPRSTNHPAGQQQSESIAATTTTAAGKTISTCKLESCRTRGLEWMIDLAILSLTQAFLRDEWLKTYAQTAKVHISLAKGITSSTLILSWTTV